MRRPAADYVQKYGPCVAFDERGRQVNHVLWVDDKAGTFGQVVLDEEGRGRPDPDDPALPLSIERIGKLKIVPVQSG